MARIRNINRVKSTPTSTTFKIGKEQDPKKLVEEDKIAVIKSQARELDIPDKPIKAVDSLIEKVDSVPVRDKKDYKAPPNYRVPVSPKKSRFTKTAKYTNKQEIGPLREMNVPENRKEMFNMWVDYLEDLKYT